MTRGTLTPDELVALRARVEASSFRAVAESVGLCSQTVARMSRGKGANNVALAFVRRYLAREPEAEPAPAPRPEARRLPLVEDVHAATGGACRLDAADCVRACRYVLASAALGSRCALEVADEGPHSLEEVGRVFGLTRERIRQIEAVALSKAKRSAKRMGLVVFEAFEGADYGTHTWSTQAAPSTQSTSSRQASGQPNVSPVQT